MPQGRCLRILFEGALLTLLIGFFSWFFGPHFVFEPTSVAGGDMVSHPFIARSLQNLWSKGALWGWSGDWFSGFPLLYFYFYPLSVIATFFQKLGITEPIAFKFTVWLVVLSVPTVFYLSARKWLDIPSAFLFACLGSVIFLDEALPSGGGTLASALTGQVSQELGMLAVVGFAGYLLSEKTHRPIAVLLFSLAILAHVYTALLVGTLWLSWQTGRCLQQRSIRGALQELATPALAIGMTCFFWGPFLFYRNSVVSPRNSHTASWEQAGALLGVHDGFYLLFYTSTVLILLLGAIKRKPILPALFVFMMAIGLGSSIPFLKDTPFLYVRVPSAVFLLTLVSLSLGISQLSISPRWKWPVCGGLGLLCLFILIPTENIDSSSSTFSRHRIQDTPTWWNWNMSGLENKPLYSEVQEVWNALKPITDREGRVAAEPFDYTSYGSARIFELTPFMTGKPIIEGLLLESSSTYPAYYFSASLFSPKAWNPGFVKYPENIDIQKGIQFLSLFNVKYFIAHQTQTIATLDEMKTPSIFQNDSFKIYLINRDSRIASEVEGLIPVLETPDPISKSARELPASMERIVEIVPGKGEQSLLSFREARQKLLPLDGSWATDGQSYQVPKTGAYLGHPKTLLFKIAYFPNWVTDSGDPVHLVSPNLIMVRTEQPNLTLHFCSGATEKYSLVVSWISLMLAAIVFLKKRRLAGAIPK